MHLAVVSLTKTYLTAGRCDISSWFHNFWSFKFLTGSSACRHNSLASKKVIYGYIRYSSEISSLIFFYDINFAYSTSLTVTVHSEQWKSAALSNIFAQSKCHRENQLSHSILSSSSSLANPPLRRTRRIGAHTNAGREVSWKCDVLWQWSTRTPISSLILVCVHIEFVFSSAPTPNLMFSKALSGSLSDCVMFNCVKWFGLKYRDLVHQPFQPCHAPGDSMDRFVSSLF